MSIPVHEPVDSFFFMTATVTHVEEGDTIIEKADSLQIVRFYGTDSSSLKTLPKTLPRWRYRDEPKCTPAKIFITPDEGSPMVPTDAQLYLSYYGPGKHVSTNPYRTNDIWKAGDKLFLITANWYEDSAATNKQVIIPVYHDRGFCFIRKIEEGDTTYGSLSPEGAYSSDSIIALTQLLIRLKKSTDSTSRYSFLKELQGYPPRNSILFTDVTPYNYKGYYNFSYSELIRDMIHKIDNVKRASLQYEYAKRWYTFTKGIERRNRDLALHLAYYQKITNKYISEDFKKALDKAYFYIPLEQADNGLDEDKLSTIEAYASVRTFDENSLPLYMDSGFAKKEFPESQAFVRVKKSDIVQLLEESIRFEKATIILDKYKTVSCHPYTALGKQFKRVTAK